MNAHYPQRNARTKKAEIVREVQKQLPDYYRQVFRSCAEDVMQQTIAGVMMTLEKCYGWKRTRLHRFVKDLQMMLDAMLQPTDITAAWSNDDNIQYLRRYGIDIKEEFKAEISYD